ncbi:MAG: hypothetical protein CMJ34_04160 [Phycisphaerae bacterium]|nr:hypothetical protein [Phycisphaerae bacterium]
MNQSPNPLLDSAMQLARRGELAAAEAMLVNAAITSPNDPRIDLSRARISANRGDPASVLSATERLLESSPGHAEALFLKAHALYSLGRLTETVDFIDGVDAGGDPKLAHNLLAIRVKSTMRDGDPKEVRADLDRLEAVEGDSTRLQMLRIELDRRTGDEASASNRCESLLARADLTPTDRAAVGLEMARLLDRDGRHAEAAEAAETANHAITPSFDAAAWSESMARTCDYFTRERLEQLPGPATGLGDRAARPVFIIGMPRSGTSLLEQIIASHPDAGGVGERRDPFLIDEDLSHLLRTPSPGWIEHADPRLLDRAAERYDSMIDLVGAPGRRVTNKALGLESMVGMLATLLPEARFIWIQRNAPDNRLSIWMHQIQLPWAWRLSDIDAVRSSHDRARDHWTSVLPERTMALSYEDLAREQAQETSRVLNFLELPESTACLEFHRSTRPVMTPSASQVREPMNDRAIGRAQAYRGLLHDP